MGNYIVLGTRSSLFLPHHDLGLIIVDEEHDSSYKQDSPAPRYNGRDTALMLNQIQNNISGNCNIILGSATPSLEEVFNTSTGRHLLVELRERYHGSEDSAIEIIDTKCERRKNGMYGNFSRKLISHINETLSKNEQVLILRSRRAWSTALQCEACGEIQKCRHCNVSLSYHKTVGKMVCHYCGKSSAHINKCSKCGGELKSLGAGTQKIEEEAANLFPNARIARLDSDTAQNKSYENKTIKDFTNGKIDILIGTQMLAKGFDFSKLRLVAVIAADSMLGMQDFRADEKAVQLLEQFRGRCGRRGTKGMFVIQTSQPEHPIYQHIASNSPEQFNTSLLDERKMFGFPPYTRIIEITVRDTYEDRAERMVGKLAAELKAHISKTAQSGPDRLTGPYSPVVDKVADQHIRAIRISLPKDSRLKGSKAAIMQAIRNFEKANRYDGHITVNVDPS
jgi:primosomal protein N' (replication factor Y)